MAYYENIEQPGYYTEGSRVNVQHGGYGGGAFDHQLQQSMGTQGSQSYSTEEMVSIAEWRMLAGRGRESKPRDSILIPLVDPGALQADPGGVPDLFSTQVPLLDYLAKLGDHVDSWKLPSTKMIQRLQSNRSLQPLMLEGLEVKELRMGETSELDTRDILKWAEAQWGRTEREFPTRVISFYVEMINTTLYTRMKITGRTATSGDKFPVVFSVSDEAPPAKHLVEENRLVNVPVRWMLGDGETWLLHIVHPVQEQRVGQFVTVPARISPLVVKFMQDLPPVTGVGVRTDVAMVEDFVNECMDHDARHAKTPRLRMLGYVDLGVLARAAGWALAETEVQSLAFVTTGLVLNNHASCNWGMCWQSMPEKYRMYAAGNVKMGYHTYNILLAILLQDLFPDPEVVCDTVGCNQFQFASWFAKYILATFRSTEAGPVRPDRRLNREHLVRSLVVRCEAGSVREDLAPRLADYIRLLGGWPAITSGGCRYLHQARRHFLHQFQLLEQAQPAGWPDFRASAWEPGMEQFILYEQPDLDRVNWTVAAERGARLGLTLHRDLPNPGFVFNELQDPDQALNLLCSRTGRSKQAILQEWARAHVNEIPRMIQLMNNDAKFRQLYSMFYPDIRGVFTNVINEPPVVQPVVHLEALDRLIKQQRREEEAIERLNIEIAVRKKRIAIIKSQITFVDKGSRDKVRSWRFHLPPPGGQSLPGAPPPHQQSSHKEPLRTEHRGESMPRRRYKGSREDVSPPPASTRPGPGWAEESLRIRSIPSLMEVKIKSPPETPVRDQLFLEERRTTANHVEEGRMSRRDYGHPLKNSSFPVKRENVDHPDASVQANEGYDGSPDDASFSAKRGFSRNSEDSSFPAKRSFGRNSEDSSFPANRGFGSHSKDSTFQAKRGYCGPPEDSSFPAKRGFGSHLGDSSFPARRGFNSPPEDSPFLAKIGFGGPPEDPTFPANRGFGGPSEDSSYQTRKGYNGPPKNSSFPPNRGYGSRLDDSSFQANRDFDGPPEDSSFSSRGVNRDYGGTLEDSSFLGSSRLMGNEWMEQPERKYSPMEEKEQINNEWMEQPERKYSAIDEKEQIKKTFLSFPRASSSSRLQHDWTEEEHRRRTPPTQMKSNNGGNFNVPQRIYGTPLPAPEMGQTTAMNQSQGLPQSGWDRGPDNSWRKFSDERFQREDSGRRFNYDCNELEEMAERFQMVNRAKKLVPTMRFIVGPEAEPVLGEGRDKRALDMSNLIKEGVPLR